MVSFTETEETGGGGGSRYTAERFELRYQISSWTWSSEDGLGRQGSDGYRVRGQREAERGKILGGEGRAAAAGGG